MTWSPIGNMPTWSKIIKLPRHWSTASLDAQIDAPLKLHLRGTNFQIKVWEALLSIPTGALTTYEHIATQIGNPRAVRAVGSAVGDNPIAYLIPCHRVIRKSGEFGNYLYGSARKKAILAREFIMTE